MTTARPDNRRRTSRTWPATVTADLIGLHMYELDAAILDSATFDRRDDTAHVLNSLRRVAEQFPKPLNALADSLTQQVIPEGLDSADRADLAAQGLCLSSCLNDAGALARALANVLTTATRLAAAINVDPNAPAPPF